MQKYKIRSKLIFSCLKKVLCTKMVILKLREVKENNSLFSLLPLGNSKTVFRNKKHNLKTLKSDLAY